MNGNVTALVVAVVGVAGTLFAALLTQRSYANAKQLELKEQHEQREDEKRRANVKERRECYIALNSAARVYRRAMKDTLYRHDTPSTDLEGARREFELRMSEEQLTAHAAVLAVAHSVSGSLADAFGRIMKYEAKLAGADEIHPDERQTLVDELDGPVADGLRQLRKVMREDLGVTDE